MKISLPFLHCIILGSFVMLGGVFLQSNVYTSLIRHTQVGVSLINSYTGQISRSTGQHIISSGGSLWTNRTGLSIDVAASTGSSFTISGDIVTSTGQGTGRYNTASLITLLSGDQSKSVQALFFRETERLYSNILHINLDTTPPSLPYIIDTHTNQILSGMIIFDRSGSIDTGIGLSGYKIHFALDPGFLGEVIISISGDHIEIPSSALPQGTLFWYIEVFDSLGNSASLTPNFFHNGFPSVVHNNYGGGGFYPIPDDTPKKPSLTVSPLGSGKNNDQSTGAGPDVIINPLQKEPVFSLSGVRTLLLSKYNTLGTSITNHISLPGQDESHNSAQDKPNNLIYQNLINTYYYHLNPIGHMVNYISWMFAILYYLIYLSQYILLQKRKSIKKS